MASVAPDGVPRVRGVGASPRTSALRTFGGHISDLNHNGRDSVTDVRGSARCHPLRREAASSPADLSCAAVAGAYETVNTLATNLGWANGEHDWFWCGHILNDFEAVLTKVATCYSREASAQRGRRESAGDVRAWNRGVCHRRWSGYVGAGRPDTGISRALLNGTYVRRSGAKKRLERRAEDGLGRGLALTYRAPSAQER